MAEESFHNPAAPLTRLLLADNHDAIRRGVRNLVESDGAYRVVGEARDGMEALRTAKQFMPDISIIE